MIVRALAGVEHDILKGAQFYEKQEPGLGHEFRVSVLADLRALSNFGGIHSKLHGFHHAICSRFDSFVIYYRMINDEIVVKAVIDGRRDPMKHVRRLQRSR